MRDNFSMRINKYLADKGISTRRGADELIKGGLIKINGRVAKLGDKVFDDDKVEVSKKVNTKDFIYILYNKPRGIVTSVPRENEKSIEDIIDIKGIFPVGRLDKNSEGLIVLTDDGRITDRLLNPVFEHEKEYKVVVREKIPKRVVSVLKKGIQEGDDFLKAKDVKILEDNVLSIVLTSGKKHQIKRMLDFTHLTVEKLKRIRIMNLKIGSLSSGKMQELQGKEKKDFLSDLGL